MISPIATGLYAALGAAAAAGLALGAYAYASLVAQLKIFGKALMHLPGPAEIALTFDDGPNRHWTPRLLDVLAKSRCARDVFLCWGHPRRSRACTGPAHRRGRALDRQSLLEPSKLVAKLCAMHSRRTAR